MEPRIIKNDGQYQQYLQEVERLAELDPDPRSDDGARLELLAKLVQDYEKNTFPFATPDPIDAILFRMNQEGLRQKDLAPFLGGKNRTSEVLARKRPLTLSMIRALHKHLGLPASLLIREPPPSPVNEPELWTAGERDAPVELIVDRGWTSTPTEARQLWKRLMGGKPGSPALLRHTVTFGKNPSTNLTNVWLWLARVRDVADSMRPVHARFDQSQLNEELIQYVVRLSWLPDGPRSAVKFLEDRGIAVVIEPHLPSTHLDGAAMLSASGTPVIGLTLREDRLDNFWFTLAHELIHAWKHLGSHSWRAIVDETIERPDENDGIESEANELAAELLLPRAQWRRSEAFLRPTIESIRKLAAQLQISTAIVAGRIRHERSDFTLFPKLVGYRQARVQFPEVHWS
jgi:HTH-type transcriptional regulator/antitoxin HigA